MGQWKSLPREPVAAQSRAAYLLTLAKPFLEPERSTISFEEIYRAMWDAGPVESAADARVRRVAERGRRRIDVFQAAYVNGYEAGVKERVGQTTAAGALQAAFGNGYEAGKSEQAGRIKVLEHALLEARMHAPMLPDA